MGREVVPYPVDKRKTVFEQSAAAAAATASSKGIVAVAGGDGTINAVACEAFSRHCALGILPQGTFNYFCRAQGIPLDTDGAVATLLSQSPKPVQIGQVNDRIFLVNASLGLYASLLEDREVIKTRYGRSRLMALYAAMSTLLKQHRPLHLRLSDRAESTFMTIASLFVGNNALQFEQVGVEAGSALAIGNLAAVVVRSRGLLSQLGLLVHGALGRLDRDDDVQTLVFRNLDVQDVRPGRRFVKVAADGEIKQMPMPLTISVAEEPLWLIKPQEADAIL